MLDVTERARTELYDRLHEILAGAASASQNGDTLGFRLVAASGPGKDRELGLMVDQMRPGDEIVAHRGRPVLMLEGAAARLLDHYVLDVVEQEGTRSLRIVREH